MAQHDYVIANGSGSAVRGDLNNALAAIVSNNSGASQPSPTYAYQWWADTNTGLLKLRNAANNAWITLRELDGTLTIEDGTASAPGLAFADDLNTGIFSPGADQIAISTNSTERVEFGTSEVVFNDGGANYDFRIEGDTNTSLFFVDASTDRVGLGTSLPQYLLHLGGGAVGAVNGQIALGSITNIPSARIDGFRVDGTFSGQLHLYTTDSVGTQVRAVTIDESQRVGVGTSAPAELLHVEGSSSPTIRIRTSTTGSTASPSSAYLSFNGFSQEDRVRFEAQDRRSNVNGGFLNVATANSSNTLVNALHIDNAQRVGVGTTSPSSLLHLADAGDITVGTTTGTKIGTATTQKLGFWNATPVVQPAAVADATDAATVITQLNDLLAKLRTLGIIAT